MLTSLRAELLVLRKSKVAWALMLTAPLLTLITIYLLGFLEYLGDTPALYAQEGTPAQTLPSLLPIQFNIEAIEQVAITAPFIVLGAVIAGGDWGRGTIKTALLAGPGRARTFAGQAAAILIACAVSVLLSFAVAAAASVTIRAYTGPLAPGAVGNDAFPPGIVIAESAGAGLLIAVTYGALGIALGTLCRSAAGGVAAALAWYFVIDGELADLSTDAGPVVQHIYNAFPEASVTTLYFMFGSSGGGASSATYQPVAHHAAVAIMLGYTAVFLGLALVLVRRRDIITASTARLPYPLSPLRRAPANERQAARGSGHGAGVLASARAELLVMGRWPAMRALVLVLPALTLFDGYLEPYALYRAGTSSVSGTSPSQVLPAILPGQYLPAVLNSIGFNYTLPGTAAFFLIGALAGGSTWAGRTIKTSLLQAPARTGTALGQALAVTAALVTSVALTFAAAGLSTLLIAVITTGSVSPAAGPVPGPGQLAIAAGIAILVSLAWGALGWTAGTALNSAAGAFAALLLWTTIIQGQLDYYATLMPKAARAVYDLLPDAATSTLTLVDGQISFNGTYNFGQVAPLLAVATLSAYALACFTLPVVLTRKRDIL
jgi:ABC-type transport system involved in multi-copper enzyme maturation permease subunit